MDRKYSEMIRKNKIDVWEDEIKKNEELIKKHHFMKEQLIESIINLEQRNEVLRLLIKQLSVKTGE